MDEGNISLEMNFAPADAGQIQLRTDRAAQTRRNYRITFSDAAHTTAVFLAFVSQYTVSGGVDALSTLAVTLEITNAITWGTAPP